MVGPRTPVAGPVIMCTGHIVVARQAREETACTRDLATSSTHVVNPVYRPFVRADRAGRLGAPASLRGKTTSPRRVLTMNVPTCVMIPS